MIKRLKISAWHLYLAAYAFFLIVKSGPLVAIRYIPEFVRTLAQIIYRHALCPAPDTRRPRPGMPQKFLYVLLAENPRSFMAEIAREWFGIRWATLITLIGANKSVELGFAPIWEKIDHPESIDDDEILNLAEFFEGWRLPDRGSLYWHMLKGIGFLDKDRTLPDWADTWNISRGSAAQILNRIEFIDLSGQFFKEHGPVDLDFLLGHGHEGKINLADTSEKQFGENFLLMHSLDAEHIKAQIREYTQDGDQDDLTTSRLLLLVYILYSGELAKCIFLSHEPDFDLGIARQTLPEPIRKLEQFMRDHFTHERAKELLAFSFFLFARSKERLVTERK